METAGIFYVFIIAFVAMVIWPDDILLEK